MKREIAKSRPESRPRPQHRRGFFLGFMFEPRNRRELSNFITNSVSVSPRSFLKRLRSSSIAMEANTHPAHQPTPQRFLIWCVSRVPCTLSRTCGDHMVTLVIFPTFSEWRRVPFFRALYFRESLFLIHECLNRDHHSCDKPLKAKVFFILYPSRAV